MAPYLVPRCRTAGAVLVGMALLFVAGVTGRVSTRVSSGHTTRLARDNPNRAYVAACVIANNQPTDVSEFVDWHRHLGIGKFYVFDNNSTVPLAHVLADYIDTGLVDVVRMDYSLWQQHRLKMPQMYANDECIKMFRRRHQWMAILESDMFLVINSHTPDHGNIAHILERYESFGGLGINWRIFGSSNLTHRPMNGTLASFTACTPYDDGQNKHIQTIVNTKHVAHVNSSLSPHHFAYDDGKFAVNMDYEKVDGPFTPPKPNAAANVHHYILRSRAEFEEKTIRGSGNLDKKGWDYWNVVEATSTQVCTNAVDQVAALGGAWMGRRAYDVVTFGSASRPL